MSRFQDEGDIIYIIDTKNNLIQNISFYYKSESSPITVRHSVEYVLDGMEKTTYSGAQKYDILNKFTGVFPINRVRLNINAASEYLSAQIRAEATNLDALDKIIINDSAFTFNIYRVLTILLIVATVILFLHLSKKSTKKLSQLLIVAGIVSALILSFVMIVLGVSKTFATKETVDCYDRDDMNSTVEAFCAGSYYFLEEPTEEFMALSNPYDYTLRESAGVLYPFDSSYYNGHFCSYFGVSPVLVLMLPFYLITGRYLSTFTATLIFMIVAIFLIAFIYDFLIKKYLPQIDTACYFMGYIVTIVGSGFIELIRGERYNITVAAGIVFILLSVILILNLRTKEEKPYPRLFFLGLSAGLIVLSKPNFIVYYIILAILVLPLLKDFLGKKKLLPVLVVAGIPLAACAVFQMYYNYLRFGNPLEFGNIYQIGANIPLFNKFSLAKLFKGFCSYFFALPSLNFNSFPFVFITSSATSPTAWNILSLCECVIGLAAIPILYPLIFKKTMKKQILLIDKNYTSFFSFSRILIFVSLLNIAISTSFASINDEYLIDVRLCLIALSVIMTLKYIETLENPILSKKVFFVLTVTTILIMLPISINPSSASILSYRNQGSVILRNIFEIWN